MTAWICPKCGNIVMMLDETDKRLVCWGGDCDFSLEVYKRKVRE
jgi:ribosomal protein S27AE